MGWLARRPDDGFGTAKLKPKHLPVPMPKSQQGEV
jgi:hypothetical protein